MLKQYKILTITHRQAKLTELAKYVIQDAEAEVMADRLADLKLQFGMEELMYLATCNRVMYFFCAEADLSESFISRFFQSVNPQLEESDLVDIDQKVACYEGEDAIRHLYGVASSIDSLVIGEREILRQLREAFAKCKKWGITGDNIRLAMQFAVEAAKEVYAKTRIGEKPISIVSLAIQKVLKYKLAKDAKILLVGAGQTNTLVAKFLVKHQFQNVSVFNRSLGKAQTLANKFNGEAYLLDSLKDYSKGFDAIIVCTGATSAIIDVELYQQLIGHDKNEKLIIDIAIPNNVATEVVNQFNIEYIQVDNLRQLAKENLAFRQREISVVETLLQKRIEDYHIQFQYRQIEHAMRSVPTEIKAIKAHALNNVFQKEMESLDEETQALVEKMMSYMEKRCISIPMKAAKTVVK